MSVDVRESMIRAAWLLISERGLEGMSTREVLARTGAPRGSVYHHFPGGRAELLEAALAKSTEWTLEQTTAVAADSVAAVVTGYLGIWRSVLTATHFRAGCPVVGIVSGGPDERLLQLGADAFAAAIDSLAERFVEAAQPETQAHERAAFLVYAAEGAVIVARAQQTMEPLDVLQDMLLRDWAEL